MYSARSASDKTDDWPFWMVWDGSLNVTVRAVEQLTGERICGLPFLPRHLAEQIAQILNETQEAPKGASAKGGKPDRASRTFARPVRSEAAKRRQREDN